MSEIKNTQSEVKSEGAEQTEQTVQEVKKPSLFKRSLSKAKEKVSYCWQHKGETAKKLGKTAVKVGAGAAVGLIIGKALNNRSDEEDLEESEFLCNDDQSDEIVEDTEE